MMRDALKETAPVVYGGPHYSPTVPAPAISYMAVQEPESTQASIPLSHYLWILRRHRWRLLAFVSLCVIVTLIISLRLTPVYEATATIDIDRQAPPGIVGQEATRATLNDSDQFLATQVKLIQSDTVLRPVAKKYRLREIEGATQETADDRAAGEAPVVLKKLKVTRPPNTYLLQISYRSHNPGLAADVANGVARSYIETTFNMRFKASASLSEFMERQIEALKAKMESSTAALAQFERELNVINPEEKTSILSARLLQLNTEYTNAQTDRMRKQVAAGSLSSGSMESALAAPQGESLRKLLEDLNRAQQHFTAIRGQYGLNHPEYRKAAGQVSEIHRQLNETRQKIAQRVNVEYDEASHREEMLRKAVTETKTEFDALNMHQFQYQQIKREAEGDKKLYEELVRRIKEAGINANFQNSSIRMADLARPPVLQVFPNVKLNLILAFLVSSLLAVGVAVVTDVIDSTIRDPEQVSREMRTEVIGSLPLVDRWKANLLSVARSTADESVGQGRARESTAFQEAVRTLRNSILLADTDRRMRSILITSATPAEGKSTIASFLAIANAELGHKTLLIDGDLRRPTLHKKLALNGSIGLSTVLEDKIGWRHALTQLESYPTLDILPAGPVSHRASELIGRGFSELLEEASQEYDLVVLDAPPVMGISETVVMATLTDGVLVIAKAGQTDRKAVASLVATMQRLRAKLIGIVLNQVHRDVSTSYGYYGYYGKYYGQADKGNS